MSDGQFEADGTDLSNSNSGFEDRHTAVCCAFHLARAALLCHKLFSLSVYKSHFDKVTCLWRIWGKFANVVWLNCSMFVPSATLTKDLTLAVTDVELWGVFSQRKAYQDIGLLSSVTAYIDTQPHYFRLFHWQVIPGCVSFRLFSTHYMFNAWFWFRNS